MRCLPLLPDNCGQDVQEQLKATPGDVQTGHKGKFLHCQCVQTLEQASE